MNNVQIKITNTHTKKCLICFSSNGLFCGENDDRFEFKNITNNKRIKRSFGKLIFIRDINRHFYIEGISKECCSLGQLINLLKKETEGYTVRTIGNSSGGFMALLAAAVLPNAECAFTFSGVVLPLTWHGPNFDYNVSDYERLRGATQETLNYLNPLQYLKTSKAKIYAFYSGYNKADQEQIKLLKDENNSNVHVCELKTKYHGDTVWSYDYKYLLTRSTEQLDKLFNFKKPIAKYAFSLKNQGLFYFVINVFCYLKRKMSKKR